MLRNISYVSKSVRAIDLHRDVGLEVVVNQSGIKLNTLTVRKATTNLKKMKYALIAFKSSFYCLFKHCYYLKFNEKHRALET